MDIYNIKEHVKQIEPTRNAVIVELIDSEFIVSIECKDSNQLNRLRYQAQKIVRDLE